MNSFYLVQSWGAAGQGAARRAADMGANKKDTVAVAIGDRQASGSATAGSQNVILPTNIMMPNIAATWLAEATSAAQLVDGMGQTLTQQHHTFGIALELGPSATTPTGNALDCATTVSVVSSTLSTTDPQISFDAVATSFDALEGSAFEQTNDTPDGENSIRWFEMTNEQGNRFYETTPSNYNSVLGATSGYTVQPYGDEKQVIRDYLTAGSPAFDMIVPQHGTVGVFTGPSSTGTLSISYIAGPLFAYSADNSQLAYVTTAGWKGAGINSVATDPVASVISSTKITAPTKPVTFSIDDAVGQVILTAAPDLVVGGGSFPDSLSYQRFYNSADVQEPYCSAVIYGAVACADPQERRLMQGWNDNFQIDAVFANDGARGLGSDSALDASAAIAAIFSLRDINRTSDFQTRLGAVFIGAWLEDQLGANAVVVRRPPSTDAFVRLPDGTFLSRAGLYLEISQTGARQRHVAPGGWDYRYANIQLSETDASGAVLNFSPYYIQDSTDPSLNDFKPELLEFSRW